MVRDHEFGSMYLLISISMPELLLLCDCQKYCAAVYCETGSVMTAGLMLGGYAVEPCDFEGYVCSKLLLDHRV